MAGTDSSKGTETFKRSLTFNSTIGSTVHIAFCAEARIVGDVPATVFLPRPKVSSVLVSFVRRTKPPVDVTDRDAFFRFARAVFGHRRKTVRNSLTSGSFDRSRVEEALRRNGVDDRARPEDLDLPTLAALHTVLGNAS